MDKVRSEFEAWAKRQLWDTEWGEIEYGACGYLSDLTQGAWLLWQDKAALTSREGEAVARKDSYEFALEWRSIDQLTDKVCRRCNGAGIAIYGSTATWRGGIGGQAMTSDVCDQCWGSGTANKPWHSRREATAAPSAPSARVAELEAENTAAVVTLAAKLRRIAALESQLAESQKEAQEQARIVGMGAERELALMAQLAASREREGRMRAIASRFGGLLWDRYDVCPECGCTKDTHLLSCTEAYTRLFKGPADCATAFDAAYPALVADKEGE